MYKTQSPDTERRLEEKLLGRYRTMSIDEKLQHMSQLGTLVVETAMAALRSRYPQETEEENRLRLLARSVDEGTMRRVYAWDPRARGS